MLWIVSCEWEFYPPLEEVSRSDGGGLTLIIIL
jgi:hypothetical protein